MNNGKNSSSGTKKIYGEYTKLTQMGIKVQRNISDEVSKECDNKKNLGKNMCPPVCFLKIRLGEVWSSSFYGFYENFL